MPAAEESTIVRTIGRGSLFWSSIVHEHRAAPQVPVWPCRHDRAIALVDVRRSFAKLHPSAGCNGGEALAFGGRKRAATFDFVRGLADRVCNKECLFLSQSVAAATMVRWGTPPFLKVPLPFMAEGWDSQPGASSAIVAPPPWWAVQRKRLAAVITQYKMCPNVDNAMPPCGFIDGPGGCAGFFLSAQNDILIFK